MTNKKNIKNKKENKNKIINYSFVDDLYKFLDGKAVIERTYDSWYDEDGFSVIAEKYYDKTRQVATYKIDFDDISEINSFLYDVLDLSRNKYGKNLVVLVEAGDEVEVNENNVDKHFVSLLEELQRGEYKNDPKLEKQIRQKLKNTLDEIYKLINNYYELYRGEGNEEDKENEF